MNTELTVERNQDIIAIEIITITENFQYHMLDTAIQLGMRFCEAKELVEHGEWGGYVKKCGYSQSSANNLMRIYREYGDTQGSLFGASAKSQTLGKLTYTKALALLAVPSEEREEFIESNPVDDMSTRELQRAIKERDEALEAQKRAEAETAEYEEMNEQLAEKIREYEDAESEVERLMTEKAELESQLATLQNAESATTAEPDESILDTVRKETAAVVKKEAEEKLKKKIAKADEDKKKAEDALAAVERDRDRAKQELERERTESTERFTIMQKQLAAANSQTMTVFKLHFETAQTALNKMLGCISELDEIEDAEMRTRLSKALRDMCAGVLDNVNWVEDELYSQHVTDAEVQP